MELTSVGAGLSAGQKELVWKYAGRAPLMTRVRVCKEQSVSGWGRIEWVGRWGVMDTIRPAEDRLATLRAAVWTTGLTADRNIVILWIGRVIETIPG
jgi:hypothetical protein